MPACLHVPFTCAIHIWQLAQQPLPLLPLSQLPPCHAAATLCYSTKHAADWHALHLLSPPSSLTTLPLPHLSKNPIYLPPITPSPHLTSPSSPHSPGLLLADQAQAQRGKESDRSGFYGLTVSLVSSPHTHTHTALHTSVSGNGPGSGGLEGRTGTGTFGPFLST